MKLDHPHLPFFKVNADWMKACGMGQTAKVFEVKELECFWDASFVSLYLNNYIWVVDCRRGQFCATSDGREEKCK